MTINWRMWALFAGVVCVFVASNIPTHFHATECGINADCRNPATGVNRLQLDPVDKTVNAVVDGIQYSGRIKLQAAPEFEVAGMLYAADGSPPLYVSAHFAYRAEHYQLLGGVIR